MTNLLAADIPAPLAALVTGASTASQRIWAHRELLLDDEWNKPPEAGLARQFSRLGCYQLAVLAHAAATQIPLGLAAGAFKHRIISIGGLVLASQRQGPAIAYWAIEAVDAALAAEAIPEFVNVDTARPYFWILSQGGLPQLVTGDTTLAKAFQDPERTMIVPITHLVAKVNAALAENAKE